MKQPDGPTAKELIAQRKARGLNQSQAARLARVGRSTLVRWENGATDRDPETLGRLLAVYRGEVPTVPRDTHGTGGDGVSAAKLAEWRATLRVTTRWVQSIEQQMVANVSSQHAAAEVLDALRRSLDEATSGMESLLDIGDGPDGDGSAPPSPIPTTPLIPEEGRTRDVPPGEKGVS